jgi:hypothetical protein
MPLTLKQSEKDFQAAVIRFAKLTGWRVQHTRTVQIRPGVWATPLQGHSGFPDLVLAHPTRGLLFVELKALNGRLSKEQKDWLIVLSETAAEVHVWYPSDWPQIEERLQRDLKEAQL